MTTRDANGESCYLVAMWPALFNILERLLKAINRETTPDQLRQSLAKDLAKIYMDIDDIVDQGREFLALFEADGLVVNDARIDILLRQQGALHSIKDHLQRVAPVLAIQLPSQASTLHLLIEGIWLGSTGPQVGLEEAR